MLPSLHNKELGLVVWNYPVRLPQQRLGLALDTCAGCQRRFLFNSEANFLHHFLSWCSKNNWILEYLRIDVFFFGVQLKKISLKLQIRRTIFKQQWGAGRFFLTHFVSFLARFIWVSNRNSESLHFKERTLLRLGFISFFYFSMPPPSQSPLLFFPFFSLPLALPSSLCMCICLCLLQTV